jgi:hypothetical protein
METHPVTGKPAPDDILDFGDSPHPKPDDDLWLEYGRKTVQDGPTAIRAAATSLMTGLGALQGVYLGILGFAKFIPENADVLLKGVFTVPLLLWMSALYHCLRVMMPEAAEINLNDPDELRRHYAEWVQAKQTHLQTAFWWLFGGMLAAIGLVILRMKL